MVLRVSIVYNSFDLHNFHIISGIVIPKAVNLNAEIQKKFDGWISQLEKQENILVERQFFLIKTRQKSENQQIKVNLFFFFLFFKFVQNFIKRNCASIVYRYRNIQV